MSDIILGISGLLSGAWNFLMHTYIPNTSIPFGVVFVGLALMSLGFRFLSLAVGNNIGDVGDLGPLPSSTPTARFRSYRLRLSDGRKNDVR